MLMHGKSARVLRMRCYVALYGFGMACFLLVYGQSDRGFGIRLVCVLMAWDLPNTKYLVFKYGCIDRREVSASRHHGSSQL